MGNLDGAGEMGKQASTTNCLHCQLVSAPFFCFVVVAAGRRGLGVYFDRWRLFRLLRDTWRSPPVVTESLDQKEPEQEFPSTMGTMGNRGMQQTECLRWWFALSDLSIPVRCSKQAEVGWRPETGCPVGWLDGFQVESWGCFQTGCCAHPLSSCRLVRQGWGPRG